MEHAIQLECSHYSYSQADCALKWANTAENTWVWLWTHEECLKKLNSAILWWRGVGQCDLCSTTALDDVFIVHLWCDDPAVTPQGRKWCGSTWRTATLTNLKVSAEAWRGTLGWQLGNIQPVCACVCCQWRAVTSYVYSITFTWVTFLRKLYFYLSMPLLLIEYIFREKSLRLLR